MERKRDNKEKRKESESESLAKSRQFRKSTSAPISGLLFFSKKNYCSEEAAKSAGEYLCSNDTLMRENMHKDIQHQDDAQGFPLSPS